MALDVNINQLRCFHAVVKAGTFSRAAEALHVSEPAVFVQVRSLERFIGFKLLEKFKKDQMPTEVGKLLYDYAEKIFVLVDEAMNTLHGLRDLKTGCLRIGATRAVCQYLMPPVVTLFQDQYPLIRVNLDEGRSEELLQGVMLHRYEIAIIARLNYPDEVNAIPFTKDDVLLVVSPASKLLQKRSVSLEELAERAGHLHRQRIGHQERHREGIREKGPQAAGRHRGGEHGVHQTSGEAEQGVFLPLECLRERRDQKGGTGDLAPG